MPLEAFLSPQLGQLSQGCIAFACIINYYPGLGWAGLEDEKERDAQLGKKQKITNRVVVPLV